MPRQESQLYVPILCPSCGGIGILGSAACTSCRARGVFAWLGGEYLTWGKNISYLRIFEERLERIVRNSINAAVMVFGVAGVIFGFLTLIEWIDAGGMPWDFLQERSGYMLVFALSLVTDLYAYSRIDREATAKQYVRARSFDIDRTFAAPPELFRGLPTEAKLITDVAGAFDMPAHQAIERAWSLAQRLHHGTAQPIHLFGILLTTTDARIVFGRLGLDGNVLTQTTARAFERLTATDSSPSGLSADLREVLLAAYREAYLARRHKVDITHLLVALAESEIPREILYALEVEPHQVRNVAEWVAMSRQRRDMVRTWRRRASHKPKGAVNRAYTSLATPLLDRFSHDLTQLAVQGALPLSVDREREVEEIFRIIESGKSNPILVGSPGVGKQSVIEQIASLMASEEVPEVLQDKRLVSLSVASLVGSSGKQGQLEGRLIQLINEVVRAGNIVLVIDNIQNMVGVSTEGAQNLDIADIFSQALEKRLCIALATTTTQDYHRYIENSGSLMRVFERVAIEEPDENQTIRILESKVGAVEYKNSVFFSYRALEQIVHLSSRYMHERFQPEKSIMILEEVGVYVRKKKGKNGLATEDDVAEVVSTRTNVPVTRVTEKESEKLLNLESRMHERVIGQDEAVTAVSTALRRARAELRDIKRPIVNLLFLGPTGVGKTELAKTVADVYFGSEDTMIRLDMSEYQEQSSINRLIGAPPGYRGQAEGGYLTEAVRTKPFSLILLDELEKAHPDILNVFLQVMDDGRLTDTTGRTIDFTNSIIIATSNAGSLLIQEGIKQGQSVENIKNALMSAELNKYFRPEFLNRFDGVIVFKPLTFEEIVQVVGLLLKQVSTRLAAKGITLQASHEAMEELARVGFDPVFGARPLRRAIQDRVDNALANSLLQGKIGRRDIAILEPGGQIRIERAREL